MRRRVTPTLINTGGGSATYIPNIISYWNFDTNFDDIVGTNNGTGTAETTIVSGGIVNDCLDNTGSGNPVIVVNDNDNLSFGNGTTDSPFSVSCWFNYDVLTNSWLFSKRNSADQEYQIRQFSGTLAMILFSQNNLSNIIRVTHNFNPVINTWYHAVFTYNGNSAQSGLKMYIDGLQVGTTTGSGTYIAMDNTTSELAISSSRGFGNFPINGQMDEVAIFDKELTALEVTELYNRGVSGTPLFP